MEKKRIKFLSPDKHPKLFSDKALPKIPANNNQKENQDQKVTRRDKKAKTIKVKDEEFGANNLKHGQCTAQNEEWCDHMEDFVLAIDNFNKETYRHLFCLFDGHGGDGSAKLCVKLFPEIFRKCLLENPFDYELAIKQSFHLMDKEIEKSDAKEIGNTATIVFINNRLLYCANVGDSCGVIVSDKNAVFITFEDKCTSSKETKRIAKAGGVVTDGRLNGVLAVSRGLGDFDQKSKGLICDPHIHKRLIDPTLRYCIIASDGVWDVLKPSDIFEISKDMYDPEQIAKKIVDDALKKGSEDNISCIVIELNRQKYRKP